jgi:hypothetical protein
VGGDEEVVADEGDFVLGGGGFNDGRGGGADRAFHVDEFDDGYARAGGRMKR